MKTEKVSARALGTQGEALAARHLESGGYTILERNARTAYGELDIVARQSTATGAVTVFVEVKTRRSTTYGPPEESVTARKRAHLLAAAQAYLQVHPELEGDWRIDVIAIQYQGAGQTPRIVYFENAFT